MEIFSRVLNRNRHLKAQSSEAFPYLYLLLCESVITASEKLLRTYSAIDEPHEGIVYWAGITSPEIWVITTVIAPMAETTWGSYKTNARTNAEVVGKVNDHKIQLLAQVHTHPGTWVGHSEGDNLGAFMPYRGFCSVIVPNYCDSGIIPLNNCGFHRFDGEKFTQLTNAEIDQFVRVIPTGIDIRND